MCVIVWKGYEKRRKTISVTIYSLAVLQLQSNSVLLLQYTCSSHMTAPKWTIPCVLEFTIAVLLKIQVFWNATVCRECIFPDVSKTYIFFVLMIKQSFIGPADKGRELFAYRKSVISHESLTFIYMNICVSLGPISGIPNKRAIFYRHCTKAYKLRI